jgi:hypothetical protein
MYRVTFAAAAALLLGACQTFIGIDDVQGHLPRLDGDYLVGLQRKRVDQTVDTIRLVGNARLDANRALNLSLNMLSATTGATVSENSISGLVFPEDASEVEFDLSIQVRPEAVTMPITNPADNTVSARMILRAEGDYAFCAVPKTTGELLPSMGSILVSGGGPPPEVDMFDTVCDGL